MAAGVNVAFGHDCVMDPWYPLGSGDMLEVASMAVHVAQLTSPEGIRSCYEAVTVKAARAIGLADYGLQPGCKADFVVLQAADPSEAIRLRATRLVVVRRGEVIARSEPKISRLLLDQRSKEINFTTASESRR